MQVDTKYTEILFFISIIHNYVCRKKNDENKHILKDTFIVHLKIYINVIYFGKMKPNIS
jgi:hypothetical protein